MAQAAWQVTLKDKAGAWVALFTDQELLTLHIKKSVNGIGTYELSIDATLDDRCDLFEVDGQVEIRRRLPGYDWQLEFEGLHRVGKWVMDKDGKETFTSSGVDYKDFLSRRAIADYKTSAGAEKAAVAETVIKEYVDEQIGPGAVANDQIAGLTIEADGAGGNAVDLKSAYQNLLDVCQEVLAQNGEGDYDIIGTGAATWEFRWYDVRRGTDRRASITFATGYGNMEQPTLTRLPATGNYVLVIGTGPATSRAWAWRPAAGAPTGIDRRTIVRDARDVNDNATYNAIGDAALEEGRAQDKLDFKVIQSERSQYGQDYFLGDWVSARYRSTDFDLKIVGVDITMGAPDTIGLEFEDV